MGDYLWGKNEGEWHALTRHDPKYDTPELVSERLTALDRAKDPNAPEHRYRGKAVRTEPGTATTLCGLTELPLDDLGVDPTEDDPLCRSCKKLAEQ